MNTAAARDNWVGRVIDERFTLLRWLGSSGSSDVFLTELPSQGSQKAAIKLIRSDGSDAEARIATWQATAPLSHPHLVRLFYVGHCQIESTHLLYAVMEFAEEDLSQIIPERPLTPAEAREMLHPVLDALSYLHKKGFVHGRLKPSNIMVVNNELKLSSDSLRVAGELGGHMPAPSVYDAPEIATGAISPASDVWSLGVTLVEALTQHPPVLDRSTHTEPVLSGLVPQRLAGIARECLQFEPARRCTLNEIKARLDPGKSPTESAGKARGIVPAKLGITALIAALVLLAVVAAVKLGVHPSRPSPSAGTQQSAAPVVAPPQSPAPVNQSAGGAIVKGAAVERVLPDVPRSARQTIQGKIRVKVEVTVSPSGDVSEAKLISAGPSKYFANLALQAARSWKFQPAKVGGQGVSSTWILPFQFGQTATEVAPVETSP
jgi:TonB family protein